MHTFLSASAGNASVNAATPMVSIQNVKVALRAATTDSTALPANISPAMSTWGSNAYGPTSSSLNVAKCWAHDRAVTSFSPCVFGQIESKRTLIIAGDSTAWTWTAALDSWGSSAGWRIIPLAKGLCSAWPDPYQTWYDHTPYPECRKFNEFVVSTVLKIKPKVVVLAGQRPVWAFSTCSRICPASRIFANNIALFAKSIAPTRAKLLSFEPSPYAPALASKCVAQNLTNTGRCNQNERSRVVSSEILSALNSAAASKVTHLVRTLSLQCTDTKCPVVAGGYMMYLDNDHLTTAYATYIAPALGELLSPLLPR